MKKIKAYIASPYTNGWAADNIRRQLEAKHILMDAGFTPFAPLECHFGEIYKHREEHDWFEWDCEWLEICDILTRICPLDENGNEIFSEGADEEERRARKWGKLVFTFKDTEELKRWADNVNKEELWKSLK